MFTIEYFDGKIVVAAENVRRISFLNVDKLKKIIMQLMKKNCDDIMLDVQNITFIDSYAFGVLMNIHQMAKERGIELKFANLNPEVSELFRLVPGVETMKVVEEGGVYKEPVLV